MGRRIHTIAQQGAFTLTEVLFVLATLGICLAVGMAGIAGGVQVREAKGAAKRWQAAAAWAQAGVVWHAGSTRVVCSPNAVSLAHSEQLCGGHLGSSSPVVPSEANIPWWRLPYGTVVTFGGCVAAPDGGGSLFFGRLGLPQYRVIVRPESGLTTRSIALPAP